MYVGGGLSIPRGVDASPILPGLYQGGKPPKGPALAQHGLQALVLMAQEIQPNLADFPGLSVVYHSGIDDDPKRSITAQEWSIAVSAGSFAARQVRAGRRVLVTCQAGVNRSGLAVALAVRNLTGRSGRECMELVRERRGPQRVPSGNVLEPLCNPSFAEALADLPPLPRRRRR